MLDEKALDIVKETAPVLKEHSHEIGMRFYKLLFSKAPELYHMFNQTNQKRGGQQEALAYAVYAAGENINHLDAIRPLVMRISEKHRALGVKPDQYQVVGETLLQAVKDVLGDAADDEVTDAWRAAYKYIADVFINIEKELYDKTEHAPGGWLGFREFIVDKKVPETDAVASFYLKPKDGKPIASFKAGQYLTLKAAIKGEKYTHMRHYSLSDAPGKDYYRITVKREDAHGEAPAGIVSQYLHKKVKEGDILEFAAPAGDFTIVNNDLPIVLISGGIGLTPVISMLEMLVEKLPERSVTFIHATANSSTHVMKERVEQLAANRDNVRSYVCYEKPAEEDIAAGSFDKEGYIDLEMAQINFAKQQSRFLHTILLMFIIKE
ncbi:nitric oxide dioxygenase [Scopulibacillus daqui]|uniref:nitric oxide dioxygenase n=1 Tax=Scopulibacillus daqui TaxID=1469162 RepID=A0ABS2PYM6_9BACL|nr:NO-inducible flavohemoprotein [Scopulibacillus daqui]MBM7645149.1 nitric oxide dioxygenase [Scopulibacillus daqui]